MAEAPDIRTATSCAWLAGVGADVAETFSDLRDLCVTLPDVSPSQALSDGPRRIARLQLRTVMKEGQLNQAGAVVGLVLWGLALWWIDAGLPAVLWLASSLLLVTKGLLAAGRFVKEPPPDDALRQREVALGRNVFLESLLAWGTLAFVVPAPLGDHVAYVAIGSLLVLAAALSLFVNYRPAISWFATPLMVLFPAATALRGGWPEVLVGIGFLAAASLMVRLARVQNHLITQTMLQAEERLALLGELEARREEAQRANQAKTRFLAAAGHDLRQPIHCIASLADTLARRPGSDAAVLGQIAASVDAMDDMLNALLEVSSLDAGALPLNLAPFPLSTLLQRLQLQFEAQAGERGIVLDVWPSEWQVFSDLHQLQRILANLVSNAVRFTAHGGVRVRCRRRGERVWIQVWDSGIGIAPADRARIFKEFVQVACPAAGGARPGIGLGLSIVQRLSRRLGCAVYLRSRPGRGSVFSVAVPLHAEPSAAADG